MPIPKCKVCGAELIYHSHFVLWLCPNDNNDEAHSTADESVLFDYIAALEAENDTLKQEIEAIKRGND